MSDKKRSTKRGTGAIINTTEPCDTGDVFEWIDSGRRGNPVPGCDCEACFGMCLVDRQKAAQESSYGYARPDDDDIDAMRPALTAGPKGWLPRVPTLYSEGGDHE